MKNLDDDQDSVEHHFIDDHSLSQSRPGKLAPSAKKPTSDERKHIDLSPKYVHFGDPHALPGSKRKFSRGPDNSHWMTAEFDTPLSPQREELLSCKAFKRPRPTLPTVSPTLISLDDDTSVDEAPYIKTGPIMLSPTLSYNFMDSMNTRPDNDPFLTAYDSRDDDNDSIKSETINDDNLFKQYLLSPRSSLSPSPTPSLEEVSSQFSEATLVASNHGHPRKNANPLTETSSRCPALGDITEGAVAPDLPASQKNKGSSIQLHVTPPKIMLRLKLSDTIVVQRSPIPSLMEEPAKKRKNKNGASKAKKKDSKAVRRPRK